MSEAFENDIEAELVHSPEIDTTDSRTIAYQIASQVMRDCKPGFVLIGSPVMGETAAGYMYPEAIGIVINETVGLTQSSMASILEEVARQLNESINSVEDYLREETEEDDEH